MLWSSWQQAWWYLALSQECPGGGAVSHGEKQVALKQPGSLGLWVPGRGVAVQGVGLDPRREPAADELRRQTLGFAPGLAVKVPDELLAEANPRISGEHVSAKIWGNVVGTPPGDIHGCREFEE